MPDHPMPEVYVQPGESHLVSQPAILRTVLGSCVGITFLIPRIGVAALCHPMLPRCPENRLAKLTAATRARYVDLAIHDVSLQLDALGAIRAETQVKLFGGGDVLSVADDAVRPTVGRLNCESALRSLEEEGFHVFVSILGGASGVHIQFDTVSGEVLLRRLDRGAAKASRDFRRSVQRAVRNR